MIKKHPFFSFPWESRSLFAMSADLLKPSSKDETSYNENLKQPSMASLWND